MTPSTQDILRFLTEMQERSQESLPVIPNNGNPMGANNMPFIGGGSRTTGGVIPPSQTPTPSTGGVRMPQIVDTSPSTGGSVPARTTGVPQTGGQRQPQQSYADRYPWLRPSDSMQNIRSFLDHRRGAFRQGMGTPQNRGPLPPDMRQPRLAGGIGRGEIMERPISLPVIPEQPLPWPVV